MIRIGMTRTFRRKARRFRVMRGVMHMSSVPSAEDVAAAESFADSVSPVVDVSTAAECASAVEPLTNYWPPDLVVHAVSYMNTTVGLEWYQAIIASTVAVRFLLAPFAIYLMKGASKLAHVAPHLQPLSEAYKSGQITQQQFQTRVADIYQKHGISNPFKPILAPFLQFPVFISFFVGLRALPDHFDLTNGGALWFHDLSAVDPYYVLPVTTALTFWAAFELNADGTNSNQQMPQMKIVMRFLAAAMVPITASFPTALLVYWNANNMFSLGQVAVLKIPGLKQSLGILPPPEKPKVGVATFPSGSDTPTTSSRPPSAPAADVLSSPPTAPASASASGSPKKTKGRKRRRAGRRRG